MDQESPEKIKLTAEQAQSLQARIVENRLTEEDKKIMCGLISFNLWLGKKLSTAQLTIGRLRKLFGFSTEKKNSKVTPSSALNSPPANSSETDVSAQKKPIPDHSETSVQKLKPQWDPTKNHGRYGFDDYSGCETLQFTHPTLRPGDHCPECQVHGDHGKLYAPDPGVLICLVGQPLITGTRYQIEKLRCSFCGKQFHAEVPPEIAEQPKYAVSCRTNIALGRYWLGLPFKRIELWQRIQNVPLPDATQWDEMKKLFTMIQPIYQLLIQLAAEGDRVYYDDTPNRILDKTPDSRNPPFRKGIYTTAIVSQLHQHSIYLFFTGPHYGAENMKSLMEPRASLLTFITMCDASPNNIPKGLSPEVLTRWIFCCCLVHGRRKFFEIFDFFEKECDLVLQQIGSIYAHERHCKKWKLNAEQRMAYHQKHSAPVLETLYIWLNNQLLFGPVEANSGLGLAIQYWLRHWEALTRFLSVPDAPLDNSLCEQAIKVAIRHRKNSQFFKTSFGAQVGDGLMSVIHSAARCTVNVFHYLNCLQEYHPEVAEHPELWLPWNYENTLALQESSLAVAA